MALATPTPLRRSARLLAMLGINGSTTARAARIPGTSHASRGSPGVRLAAAAPAPASSSPAPQLSPPPPLLQAPGLAAQRLRLPTNLDRLLLSRPCVPFAPPPRLSNLICTRLPGGGTVLRYAERILPVVPLRSNPLSNQPFPLAATPHPVHAPGDIFTYKGLSYSRFKGAYF